MMSNFMQTAAVLELTLLYYLLITATTQQQLPLQILHPGRHDVLQDVNTDALLCKKQFTFSRIAVTWKPAALAIAGQLCVRARCLPC